MKTVIVYYSMSGNTEQTARKIAEITGADLLRIEPVKEYPSTGMRKFLWGGKSAVMGEKPKLKPYRFEEGYDRVIFGTPVWASNIAPPLRSFVKENEDMLEGKSFSAFVCCSGGGGEKALLRLKTLLKTDDFVSEMILIDPKDIPSEENDQKIQAFCDNMK